MKKICVLMCLCFAVAVFAQTDRAGTIVSVKGSEILVRNENVDAPFMAGEKLFLKAGDPNVVIEVTFPMQTVVKCRLVEGSAAKLRAGMIVYSGGLPSERGRASAKPAGAKTMKDMGERVLLPDAAFVLKDALVPEGGITFPIGTSDEKTARIEKGFLIAETETTWAQWTAVKKWAEAHGYSFGSTGENGRAGDLNVTSESDFSLYPVTRVNWRDAIVWCNALTEYFNAVQGKAVLDCVYYADASYETPLRISTSDKKITDANKGSQDCPYIKASSKRNVSMENCIAKGFRLPASEEWEYAARYRGSDSSNAAAGYKNPFFTKGDSASGASGNYEDKKATGSAAVFDDGSVTHAAAAAKVKSKKGNALGLYDMSGNVYEWCFEWYEGKTENRVLRGGGFSNGSVFTRVGSVQNITPFSVFSDYGFRISRTK